MSKLEQQIRDSIKDKIYLYVVKDKITLDVVKDKILSLNNIEDKILI
jgi:hypothetical protein